MHEYEINISIKGTVNTVQKYNMIPFSIVAKRQLLSFELSAPHALLWYSLPSRQCWGTVWPVPGWVWFPDPRKLEFIPPSHFTTLGWPHSIHRLSHSNRWLFITSEQERTHPLIHFGQDCMRFTPTRTGWFLTPAKQDCPYPPTSMYAGVCSCSQRRWQYCFAHQHIWWWWVG